MAEQESAAPAVDQVGMQDDYFSSHSLVDDGGEVAPDQPEKPEKPAQKPAPRGDLQKPAKPAAQAGDAAAPAVPEGFESTFFDTSEDGQSVFSRDRAMEFLAPKDDPLAFKFQPKAPAAPVGGPSATPAGGYPGPQEKPWEKELRERREYETNLRSNLMAPLNMLKQAAGAKLTPEIAQHYQSVEQQVETAIRQTMDEYDYERRSNSEEAAYQKEQQAGERAKLESQAAANEATIARAFGGDMEKYHRFMFGHKDAASGKYVPGPSSDAINFAYDRTKREGESMGDWWRRWSADMDNLRFVFDAGRARLQRQLWPHITKTIGDQREKVVRGQQRSQVRKPSAINSAPDNKGKDRPDGSMELDKYLGIDTV